MQRSFILTLIALGASTAVFVGSFLTFDRTRYKNDFVRMIPPHAADIAGLLKVQRARYSMAGVAGGMIFLRDRSDYNGLLSVDTNSMDTARINIKVAPDVEIMIDSPHYFLHNGHTRTFQRGKLNARSLECSFDSLPKFTAIQPTSGGLGVLRTIDLSKRKNLLLRSDRPKEYHDVLEKQVDGILCTDGYINYSKGEHLLVYTYRYRNQFIVLDTALNIKYRGKTIDTTFIAKISVVETDGKITMSKPPLIVNKGAWVDGQYLYINSNLVARNESIEGSKDRSVIDVYNILDQSYRFSFYINNVGNSRMQSFRVKGNMLIAMFPEHVTRYDIPEEYISN